MTEQCYAGFWRRAATHVIDALLFFPVTGVLLAGNSAAELLVPFVFVVAMWMRFGATPGKFLMRCRVVDANTGGQLRLGQAALRYIAYVISALPLMLGFLWAAWDRRKQGFHDKIAGTMVLVVEDEDAEKSLEQLMKESGV